jgi:hypothetical protein
MSARHRVEYSRINIVRISEVNLTPPPASPTRFAWACARATTSAIEGHCFEIAMFNHFASNPLTSLLDFRQIRSPW